MKAYFSRRYQLCASHRLYNDELSELRNLEVFGKCSNPFGHGHNYIVEVTVAGQVDPMTGMVCNMVDLDECVGREILQRFDHANLNLHPAFETLVPTTENFCIAIYDLLRDRLPAAQLSRVRIEETRNNSFEYSGGADSDKSELQAVSYRQRAQSSGREESHDTNRDGRQG